MLQRYSGSRCCCCSGGSSPSGLDVSGCDRLPHLQTCSYSLFHTVLSFPLNANWLLPDNQQALKGAGILEGASSFLCLSDSMRLGKNTVNNVLFLIWMEVLLVAFGCFQSEEDPGRTHNDGIPPRCVLHSEPLPKSEASRRNGSFV